MSRNEHPTRCSSILHHSSATSTAANRLARVAHINPCFDGIRVGADSDALQVIFEAHWCRLGLALRLIGFELGALFTRLAVLELLGGLCSLST
mmetsp:Transcript_17646/g.53373  ORF Transcript_17646/g.53373 Transcript_17646/m.53373 type:complete len:93 (+) Transcript_17646:205-483(+)